MPTDQESYCDFKALKQQRIAKENKLIAKGVIRGSTKWFKPLYRK